MHSAITRAKPSNAKRTSGQAALPLVHPDVLRSLLRPPNRGAMALLCVLQSTTVHGAGVVGLRTQDAATTSARGQDTSQVGIGGMTTASDHRRPSFQPTGAVHGALMCIGNPPLALGEGKVTVKSTSPPENR